MSETSVILETDWLNTQVELFKTLESYELSELDKEEGYVDYISEKGGEKRLLRVLIDEGFNEAKAYVSDIEEVIKDVEDREVDEAVILGKRLSVAGRRIVRNDGMLNFVSENSRPTYSPVELMMAVGIKVKELCTSRCGKLPANEEECKSSQKWELPCQVRRFSDDADFHAEMQWTDLLVQDFSRLVELKKSSTNPSVN